MLTTTEACLSAGLLGALPLEAGPVRLRRLRAGDLPAFLAYRRDPEVALYQGFSPMDDDAAAAFLREMAQAPAPAPGQWLQLGIARSDDDAIVGDVGLLHERHGQVQLGFSLARSAQGRGWANAVLGALCDRLLVAGGCRTLRAVSDSRNARSLRLLQRLGFREVAREGVVVRGERCVDVTLERTANTVSRPRTEVFIACSLDGFIARPDGALDWLMHAQASAPPGEDFGYAAFMAGVDTLVIGRKTFETVLDFDPWPYAGKSVHVMTRQHALHVPATLQQQVRAQHESPSALLSSLAADGARVVYLDGGELIQSFLAEDLVDRLTITTVPVLIGRGRRLFGVLPEDRHWKLEAVRQRSECGFVQTCWQRYAPHPAVPFTSGESSTALPR